MTPEVVEAGGKSILVLGGEPIVAQSQALDIVSLAAEYDTTLLLFDAGMLGEAFTDLRTGVAGAVIQKLVNYRLTAAAVISDEVASAGRFGELMQEMNRGATFRAFATRAEALAWLAERPQLE